MLAVLAAAGALELGARALASSLDEPLWWHDRFTQRKELQMMRLRRRGGADIVLLGSSKVLLGLDPAAFHRVTGLRCYNASIYRGLPGLSEAWLQDRVLPMLRPRFVLIGISPSEVNDNTPLNQQLGLYRSSRVFSAGRLALGHRRAGQLSAAVRLAPLLRQPRVVVRAMRSAARRPGSWHLRAPAEIPGVLGPHGEGLNYLDRTYGNGPRMRELYHQLAADYDDGGIQSGALRRMPLHVEQSGGRVVFIALPGSAEYIDDTFEGGRAAWEESKRRLALLAEETGCWLIDVSAGFEDHSYYADMLHLNRTGRDAFSSRVAEALLPRLEGEA